MNAEQIRQRRSELESELAQLQADEQRLAMLTPVQRVADMLHDYECRSNHTDQCGYGYDSWDNPGQTRQGYLHRARTFYDLVNDGHPDIEERCINLLKAIFGR